MSDPFSAQTRLTARQATAADPAFAQILIQDYYDGPESGIARTADGAAYRFSCINESRYRLHRAYLIEHLLGEARVFTEGREGFLSDDEWVAIQAMPVGTRYVAVGDLWLRHLVAEPLGEARATPTTFGEVHQMLRSKFVSANAGPARA